MVRRSGLWPTGANWRDSSAPRSTAFSTVRVAAASHSVMYSPELVAALDDAGDRQLAHQTLKRW